MKSQRGAIGIVIAIAAVLILAIGGGYFVLKNKASSNQAHVPAAADSQAITVATAESGVPLQSKRKPRRYLGELIEYEPPASSLVKVDVQMSKDKSAAYLKRSSGGDSRYVKIPVADPASLVRLYPSLSSQKAAPGAIAHAPASPFASASASNSTSYYQDSQNVYVLQNPSSQNSVAEISLAVIAGADPATFVLLSDQYAKDATRVYFITSTCDDQGICSPTLTLIPDADPATFQAFEASVVDRSNGVGTVTIDAVDINSEYYSGIVVDVAWMTTYGKGSVYGTPDENGLILLAP